jgi:hypothetical protein
MKLLISGSAILGAVLSQTADTIHCEGPLDVPIKVLDPGWAVVSYAPADVPADFTPDAYQSVSGALVRKVIALDPLKVQAAASLEIQKLLDSTAQASGYDSVLSAVSYQTSTNAAWKAEGAAFMAWRDACWAKAEQIQNAVLAGGAVPTVASVVAQMPKPNWLA